MRFYRKLFNYVLQKEKLSAHHIAFFIVRWCLILLFVYSYPKYYLCSLLFYRIFLSNLVLIDNQLLFSKADISLFAFSGRHLFPLFLFQKLFLNKFYYRILYVIGILLTLFYSNNFLIISLILLIEFSFFILEYLLFTTRHLIGENKVNIKILGEVAFLSLLGIGLLIHTNITLWLSQYLVEAVFLALVIYFIYLQLFIWLIKKFKPSGRRGLIDVLYKKIDIFLYKEIKLFGRSILIKVLTLLMSVSFFLLDNSLISSYAVLFVVASATVFVSEHKGDVINMVHDNYFLNKSLFSKTDNFKIISKKLVSYFKISLLVKIPIVLILNVTLSQLPLIGIINIFGLILVLVLNELNAFNTVSRLESLLHYTIRYLVSLLVFIYIYLGHYSWLFLFLIVCFLKEGYQVRSNFLKLK